MEYFLIVNGEIVGPMTARQLVSYNIDEHTSVSVDGIEWKPLYRYPELMYEYRNQMYMNPSYSDAESKRILCGVLAILIGTLGIHYFLMGKTRAGIFTILLSLVSCGLWGVVMFVQGIMMLIMSDMEFRSKYIDTPSSFPIF